MKKLFTVFTLVLCFGFTQTSAQKFAITGTVVDSAGKGMQNATVLLLAATDSSLVSFSRTTDKGVFTLKNVPSAAEYLLKVTFVGYDSYFEDIKKDVKPNDAGVLELGGIRMTPHNKLLDAATVTGYKDPVKINGDTTEFNASSFKVQPNAVAEDLIKKLPGVEVAKDGSVTAMGETVTQVFVNGKKFFGKDPKVALQNLPAGAIDKVKVYDKRSDQSEFSGIDDGEREKTIDLTLKTDYSKGTFGNVMAGAGAAKDVADARYIGKFSINKFSKTQQISFLGLGNNINKTGFSVDDYMGFTGTTQRGGGGMRIQSGGSQTVPLDFGNNKGLQSALSGGLNFNNQFSPKTELNLSYFYNDVINSQTKVSDRENFLTNGSFKTHSEADSRTENQNHRVNITLDQKIDTFTSMKITSVLSATRNYSNSSTFTENLRNDDTPQTSSKPVNYTEGSGLSMQNSLLLRRRFMKKGRTMSTNIFYNVNQSDRNGILNSENKYFNFGSTGTTKVDSINQTDDRINKRDNYGATVSFTEPLGNRQYLELNYNFSTTTNDADREVYDLQNGESKYNSTLSNKYINDYIFNKAGLTYRLNRKEWNLATGLQYQYSTLKGEFISRGTTFDPLNFNFVLPNVRFDYNPVQGKSMRFAYETSVREPSIDQLQPIRDNTDPLNIYIGNPNLRPEYNNRFSVNFNRFNQSNFHMFFGNFNFTYASNKISTMQTVDASFRRETTPINVKNDKQGFGFFGFGMPLYKQVLRMNVTTNANLGQGIALVNGTENVTNRTGVSLGLRLSVNIKDSFDVNFNGRIQSNKTTYSLNTNQNQQYYNYTYDVEANYRLPFGMRLSTDFDYTIITGQTFGTTQGIPIWGASVSKYMFKQNKGELKFAIFDILNRNTGINRTADVNYILNEVTSSLGRYAMLTFTYNLNPMMGGSGGRSGGNRMMYMQRN